MARQISDDVKAQRERFSATLSDAIRDKDLTLETICARLAAAGVPASAATLSYWQNGHSMPTRGRSIEVVKVLENILEIPLGTLTSILGKGAPADWRLRELMHDVPSVEEVLSEWDLDLERRFTSEIVQQQWFVLADQRTTIETVRQVMRVEGELEQKIPLIYRDSDTGMAPRISNPRGGRFGRIHTDDENGILIGEFLLPRPMRRGERFWIEFTTEWAPVKGPFTQSLRQVPVTTSLLTLDVTFEGEPPVSCEYSCDPSDGAEVERRPLEIHDGRVQVVLQNAVAGAHGLEWHF